MSSLVQQPTDFTINTYYLKEVFDSRDLISSLALFSENHQLSPQSGEPARSWKHQAKSSILFLKIESAAAYFTANTTLMRNAPLVDVDISMPIRHPDSFFE